MCWFTPFLVQILFEGGTENDLRALEEEEEDQKRKERPPSRHQTLDEGQALCSEGVKVCVSVSKGV